ncbi:MAG TPA: ABC transporter permease subunit, partial [Streptosporangiaceae bacterium]
LVSILIGVSTGANSQEGCPGGPCHYVVPTGPGGEAVTDTFYFVHRPLTKDGSITVRVTSLAEVAESGLTPQGPAHTQAALVPWSKAGLIITAGPGQGSAYAAVMVTGSHGTRMQWNYTGDTPGLAGRVSAVSPRWLRLTRAGDVITGYDSADGTRWTKIGSVGLPGLASTVQAGLFATSPAYSQQLSQQISGGSNTGHPTDATATFDRVGLHGGWPGSSWTGTSVKGGPNSPYVTGHEAGYRPAGSAFTVTGSGDIAPDVTDGVPIDVLLAGLFLALIAVLVVGAQFMTAEYRRGLIRITLAASPRRSRVLAAKALVLGLVAFVAGLAGAAAAVLFGRVVAQNQGLTVFPVSALTELRAIVGTGLLVAVAAVFTLAVATMLRRSAAAIMVAIVAIVLPFFLAFTSAVPQSVGDWLLRITPAAAFALQQPMTQYHQVIASYRPMAGFFPLAPWVGFAVLCAWAAVALGGAGWLLRRRDA